MLSTFHSRPINEKTRMKLIFYFYKFWQAQNFHALSVSFTRRARIETGFRAKAAKRAKGAKKLNCNDLSVNTRPDFRKHLKEDFIGSMNRIKFSFVRFSLTPTLSRWERANCPPTVCNSGRPFWFKVPMHANAYKYFDLRALRIPPSQPSRPSRETPFQTAHSRSQRLHQAENMQSCACFGPRSCFCRNSVCDGDGVMAVNDSRHGIICEPGAGWQVCGVLQLKPHQVC
jgi:hypothetical protein